MSVADDSEVSDDALEQQLAEIVAAQLDKMQHGQSLNMDELIAAHPQLAKQIQDVWPALLLADVAGHCAATEDEPTSSHRGFGSLVLGCDQTPEAIPSRMGDYELVEQIGRGGMGVVFKAKQLSLGRMVAIKMIQGERLSSEHERKRFVAEAQATARLDHPGIVPVYEVGEFDGHPFFSMQLIVGQTLAERLADGPMPQREASRLMASVARAIHHAHQQGILHRDIKPSNIIIGADGRPLVTDFGLAKIIDAGNSLTNTGSILGTPSYMSPEQAAGQGLRLVQPLTSIRLAPCSITH